MFANSCERIYVCISLLFTDNPKLRFLKTKEGYKEMQGWSPHGGDETEGITLECCIL